MEIELYGHYYYRDENHIPHRITIVDITSTPGFFWYVDGHFTKDEIFEKDLTKQLIHKNRITQ